MIEYSNSDYENGIEDDFGVVYSKDGSKLMFFTRNVEVYRIKDGTRSICDKAFYRCYRLKSIYLPDTVTEIGDEVFFECYNLSDIRLSENLTDIGTCAFRDCKNIKKISLPESLERLGVSSFNGCVLLDSIDIPTHIIEIPAYAFSGCQSLKHCSCKYKLKKIGERAFLWCVNLESIIFEQKDIIWNYPSALKIHKVPIISGIEKYAFEGCTSIKHLELPQSISFIEKCAFYNCI